MLLLKVAPACETCEADEGVEGGCCRGVVVFDFSPDAFEGGNAEAGAGLLEDAFAEIVEILIGPGGRVTPAESIMDEVFALIQ